MMYKNMLKLLSMFLLVLNTINCGGGGGGTTAPASPTITAITPSGTANIGSTITLVATASDPANLPLTYSWDFGDGLASDTGATVYRVYNVANTYTVVLTVTNSASKSSTKELRLTIGSGASSNIVADCSGTNCSATTSGANDTYLGTGTGVWRYNNLTNAAVTRDINIQGVAGKTVTLLFSNGQASTNAPTVPTLGILSAPVPTFSVAAIPSLQIQTASAQELTVQEERDADHERIETKNYQLAIDLIRKKNTSKTVTAFSPANSTSLESVAVSAPAPVTAGVTKNWIENGVGNVSVDTSIDTVYPTYATTAQRICTAGTLGRKVIFWVQDGEYPSRVTSTNLDAYQALFCGTNNDNGAYANIAKLLGDVWGIVPSAYVSSQIADSAQKQDVNIVFVTPGGLPVYKTASWGGYFFNKNNFLNSALAGFTTQNSNEALVFFVNARQTSQNYVSSVLMHELTHMINYYQRTILHDDAHENWLEETSAMMTEDIFDPILLSGYSTALARIQGYATSSAYDSTNNKALSYFTWSKSISSSYYNIGGAFAAYINRRYGPVIYLQLMTDCYTPTTNTSSFACLDFLIKKNGGEGFASDFGRFGASIFGRIGGTNEPINYGFPTKSGSLNGTVATPVGNLTSSYTYALPAFDNWWAALTIPQATSLQTFSYTSQTYQIDTVASNKTSYVRTGVSVPAKTSIIAVVK
jgi:hypothetical protein